MILTIVKQTVFHGANIARMKTLVTMDGPLFPMRTSGS